MLIEVVQSPGCTKCKASIEIVKKVVADYPQKVDLGILSVIDNLQRIVELEIFSTPCVLINGKIAFSRIPKEKELREKIETLLKEGK